MSTKGVVAGRGVSMDVKGGGMAYNSVSSSGLTILR